MSKRIVLTSAYTQKVLSFGSYPKSVYLPYINVVLKNLETGNADGFSYEFLVDTGAFISIINKKYQTFVESMKPADSTSIQYGLGRPKACSVYRIGAIIKGEEFEIPVAYDDDCPFLLLGHYGFMEHNAYNLFDSITKKVKLVRL